MSCARLTIACHMMIVCAVVSCGCQRAGNVGTPESLERVGFHDVRSTAEGLVTRFVGTQRQTIQATLQAHGDAVQMLELKLRDSVLRIAVDPVTSRVTVRGRPWRVSQTDRVALAELAQAAWAGDHRGPLSARDVLLRRASGIAAYLAEGPSEVKDLSFKLGKPHPPGTPQTERRCCPCEPTEETGIPCDDCPRYCEGGGGSPPSCVRDDNGNDGILFLPDVCCSASPPGADMPESHDACQHRMEAFPDRCGWTRQAADGAGNWCEGRCGIGCAAAPIYTQDCLDHDRCLAHRVGHADGDCDDETTDAFDDFAFIYLGSLGAAFLACANCPQPCVN